MHQNRRECAGEIIASGSRSVVGLTKEITCTRCSTIALLNAGLRCAQPNLHDRRASMRQRQQVATTSSMNESRSTALSAIAATVSRTAATQSAQRGRQQRPKTGPPGRPGNFRGLRDCKTGVRGELALQPFRDDPSSTCAVQVGALSAGANPARPVPAPAGSNPAVMEVTRPGSSLNNCIPGILTDTPSISRPPRLLPLARFAGHQ